MAIPPYECRGMRRQCWDEAQDYKTKSTGRSAGRTEAGALFVVMSSTHDELLG